jgi:hypothetical protein
MAMLDLLDQVENSLTINKVGIEEFAESDQFCDKPLYPRQKLLLKLIFLEELTGHEEDALNYWIKGGRNGSEITISPNIRERITYLREHGYNHFREIVLVGGRRSSKGFCTGMAMAKVMYDTLQLQDPGRHYGIDPDKDIYFSCVAGSEAQAKEFQYADFSSTVESCKAFEPYVLKSLETEMRIATPEDIRRINQRKARGVKLDKDIAKLRGKALAANAGTLRGSATMALAIDEMAHMIAGESKASADLVYNAATPALDQFGKDGIIFCNSSPYSKVGMFYERHLNALVPFDPNYAPGIKQCGNSCTFGCFHGVLMEMFQTDSDTFGGTIEDESPEMLLEHVRSVASSLCTRPEVEAVIQRRACYHGLGHVFETMSNNDISSGVTSCEVFSSAHAKEACVTGVFMEYLFNASSTPLRITKGQEPCSAFPEYTNQCYIYKAYGWIRAWGSVDAALKACTTFGEHELLCIRNVARAATTEEILASEDKINAQCGGLSGPDHDECIKGTLLKTIFLNDGDDSDHACDGVTEAYRPACVRELHSFLENTI